MKNKISTIVLLLCVSICVAQKDKYNYKLNYELIHTDRNNKEVYKENLLLLCNNTKSIFISQNKLTLDSLRSVFVERGDYYGFREYKRKMHLKTHFTSVIIKNYKTNNYTLQDKEIITTYKYTEKTPVFNWVIDKGSTKKIFNYNCKLATTNYKGRNYEAWFTEDIPIVDGPYKFTGLPGLIVNIYDTKKEYNFLLTGLMAKKGNFPKIKTKNVIEIKKSQLKKIKEGAEQEFINRIMGDKMKNKLKQKIKERNKKANPIELETK